MNYNQTKQELINHLKEQIKFLKSSAFAYDQGSISEAKRIAGIVRILLHDTHKSTSLLKLLNRKNILFYDTSIDFDSKNLLPTLGLVLLRVGTEKSEYIAPLGDGAPSRYGKEKIDFNAWWNKVVLVDKNKNSFSRKDLVLKVSNKDGGAHIDKELPEDYYRLTRENSLDWEFKNIRGEEGGVEGCELASLRQIGHEVLESLTEEFLDFN